MGAFWGGSNRWGFLFLFVVLLPRLVFRGELLWVCRQWSGVLIRLFFLLAYFLPLHFFGGGAWMEGLGTGE